MTVEQEKPKTKIDALEDSLLKMIDIIEDLGKRVEKLEKTSVKKAAGLFGGKKERTAIKDTKTGIIYVSKAATGKALAAEFNFDVLDHFAWYKIITAAPDRFVDATEEESQGVWEKEKKEREKEVAEANKRLADEAAKKAKQQS